MKVGLAYVHKCTLIEAFIRRAVLSYRYINGFRLLEIKCYLKQYTTKTTKNKPF